MSSNDVAPSGSGGSGSGPDRGKFIDKFIETGDVAGGFNVRWAALLTAGVTGVITAFFSAIISIIESFGIAAGQISFVIRSRIVRFVEAVFSATGIMDAAWGSAAADLASTGIFAFAISVGIVGLVTIIYQLGVTYIVE